MASRAAGLRSYWVASRAAGLRSYWVASRAAGLRCYSHVRLGGVEPLEQRLGSHPLDGQPAVRHLAVVLVVLDVSRQAEVGDLQRFLLSHEDVAGGQVTVDALRMRQRQVRSDRDPEDRGALNMPMPSYKQLVGKCVTLSHISQLYRLDQGVIKTLLERCIHSCSIFGS